MSNSSTTGPPIVDNIGDRMAPIMTLYMRAKKQSSFFHVGQFCATRAKSVSQDSHRPINLSLDVAGEED